MADNILRVEHLKKYFPVRKGLLAKEHKVLKAVNDVSLTIHQGEIFGVVGESGCGKSTLARCIMSLSEATDGQIYFQEKEITRLNNKELKPFRRNMQMVFQNPFSSFNPTMSIKQTFYEIGKVYGLSAADIKARCKELMGQVRLSEEVLTRRPEELSGGQLQRLAIARAMFLNPTFILMDEAVSALDVSVQAQILNLIMDLRDSLGLTMLFISHDLTVVEHVCDTVLVMYLGSVVEMAPTRELFENLLHPYSQALISAKPKEYPSAEANRIVLEGEAKTSLDSGEGCLFAPRCHYCQTGLCDCVTPQLRELTPEHFVACHRYNKMEEQK